MQQHSVLHVAQPIDGGVPSYVAALARFQAAAGWRVKIAAPESSEAFASTRQSSVGSVAWEARRNPDLATISETRRLRSILAASDASIIHLHSAKAGLAGRSLLRGRRPTLFQPHAWSFEAAPPSLRGMTMTWERWAARWSDRIVCVSNTERQVGVLSGISARWAVVPNGVDLRRWKIADAADRSEARTALGLRDCPLVVSVGRVSHQKGHDVLLDAWVSVRERVPEAELVVVGDGPERGRLAARGVPGVSFVGETAGVREWIVASNVIALPSRYEGMSLAMLEAMASARSVVITDVGGARETLGTTRGAVVPVEDRKALAAAISRRLLDPQLAHKEGHAAREQIERAHSFDRTGHNMLSLYADVLAEREAALTGRSGSADA